MSGAEAIAVIGAASSIAQFIEYGAAVLRRLQDFKESVGSMPKAFKGIENNIQLLLTCLATTEKGANSDTVTDERRKVLYPVLTDCRAQLQDLDGLLQKHLPKDRESPWRIGWKAVKSVREESQIEKIRTRLQEHVQYLTYFETSRAEITTHFPAPQSGLLGHAAPFMVPFDRDTRFVGRLDLLNAMDSTLDQNGRVGIFGVGGVGKTQLGIEYCYRYRDSHLDDLVLWIHASSLARMAQSFQQIAERLALPGWNDSKTDIVLLVNSWLSREDSPNWLLVIDNVDDLNSLVSSELTDQNLTTRNPAKNLRLPKLNRGRLLMTTRDKRISHGVFGAHSSIFVPHISEDEATILLQQQIGHTIVIETTEKLELFELLGHLPLAIAQATAFMHENCVSVKSYLEMLRGKDADVQDLLEEGPAGGDPRRDHDSDTSIFKTWRLSFESIRKQHPRAADMLALMAMLDRQSISQSLLRHDGEREIEVIKALGTLRAFSLVDSGSDSTTYSLHRLVQLATQTWLETNGEKQEWQFRALELIAERFPFGEYETFADCAVLAPHAAAVLQYMPPDDDSKQTVARLSRKKGWFDKLQGRYSLSVQNLEKAVALQTEVLGPHHPETLDSMWRVIMAAIDHGLVDAAHSRGLAGVELCTNTLGPVHELTLRMERGLAIAYQWKHAYSESDRLLNECIENCRILGIDNSDFAQDCMSDLATSLRMQSKFTEGEALQKQIVERDRQSHGPIHPETLMSMHNLAFHYHDQRRFDEAEILLLDVIAHREIVLGKDHPQVVQSKLALALVLRGKGDFQNAESTATNVLSQYRQLFGEDHSYTMDATRLLSLIYGDQKRWEDAVELERNVWEFRRNKWGPSHVEALNSSANLLYLYRKLGRDQDAAKLYVEALVDAGTQINDDIVRIRSGAMALSAKYAREERWDDTVGLVEQALASFQVTLGNTHSETASCRKFLAQVYTKLDRHEEANAVDPEAERCKAHPGVATGSPEQDVSESK